MSDEKDSKDLKATEDKLSDNKSNKKNTKKNARKSIFIPVNIILVILASLIPIASGVFMIIFEAGASADNHYKEWFIPVMHKILSYNVPNLMFFPNVNLISALVFIVLILILAFVSIAKHNDFNSKKIKEDQEKHKNKFKNLAIFDFVYFLIILIYEFVVWLI